MNAEGATWWARWQPQLWRWRWWLAGLTVLVLVRANLPWILRRVIVSQASEALQADVTLGDVDLAFYRGGVALEDFAIRLRGTSPPAPDGGTGDAAAVPPASAPAQEPPATSPSPAPSPPILAWKNLVVSLRWLPLVRQTIQLREITLDSPQVQLERLASGEFNYEALIRAALAPADTAASEATAAAPAADNDAPPPDAAEGAPADDGAAGSSGWWLGIDRLALLGGHVRFRDHMLEGSEPIDIAIPTIEVRDISMVPDLYGKPSESRLKVALDEGALEVGTRATMSGNDIDLECDLHAQALPLRHARLYVPRVGWSELTGAFDADLEYRLETGKVNEVRGTVALRDLAVRVPSLPKAALSWTRLAVRVDPIDLIGQVATVAEVDLSGAWLAGRGKRISELPVFAGPDSAGASTGAGPAAPADEPLAEAEGTPPSPAAPVDAETAPAATSDEAEAGTPWRWSVQSVRVSDSGLRLLDEEATEEATLDVRLGAQVTDISPSPDTVAHVNLTIGVGDGSVQIEGRARLEPPGFAGDVNVSGLSLSEPLAITGAVPEGLVESAKLETHLAVEAGMAKAEGAALGPGDARTSGTVSLTDAIVRSADTRIGVARIDVGIGELALAGAMPASGSPGEAQAPVAKGTLRLRGDLSVRDASVALVPPARGADGPAAAVGESARGPGPGDTGETRPPPAKPPAAAAPAGSDFSITLGSLDLALSDLTAPGLLGGAPIAPEPMRVAIGELKLEKPAIRMTRTAAGIALPTGKAAPVAADAPPSSTETTVAPSPPAGTGAPLPATDAAATAGPPAGPPAAGAGAGLEVTLDSLRLTKGRFAFADRTLKPPFAAAFDDITVSGRGLRFPELAAKDMRIALSTPGEGEIEMSGAVAPRSGKLELDLQNVALMPYNPYAAAFSPYRVASGALSVSSDLKRSGTTYEVANEITLQDFDVEGAGGEGVFERQFGIPLAMALALMRDTAGKITLNVPVEIGERGTSVDVMAVVGNALRAALLGALTSPLKLVGSLTGGGGQVGSFAPAPIVFHTGRAETTDDGAAVIERLATLLESRPAMGVELQVAATAADARWLREQALLVRWGEEGFLGGLLALADRGARTRVREALEARAKDETGELSAEDAEALEEWLRDVPEATPEQLRELQAQRLAAVRSGLREGKPIEETRIVGDEPTGKLEDAAPAVQVKLRPVSKLGIPAEPLAPEDPGPPAAATPDLTGGPE